MGERFSGVVAKLWELWLQVVEMGVGLLGLKLFCAPKPLFFCSFNGYVKGMEREKLYSGWMTRPEQLYRGAAGSVAFLRKACLV